MIKQNAANIRNEIGKLIYEQQLYQNSENDTMLDQIEGKITSLRSKLLLVEQEENAHDNEEKDQG